MKKLYFKTLNQGIDNVDRVELDDIKGGNISGSALCCIMNSNCNQNGRDREIPQDPN